MPCRPKVPTGRARYVLPGINPGLIVDGNINLFTRPHVFNKWIRYKDQWVPTYSSVDSTSFTDDGLEVLMPTVIPVHGKWIIDRTGKQAFRHYKQTGQQLGIFDNVPHANAYANRLHLQQQRIYAGC